MLATINPSPDNYEECAATLQFANRCRHVTNLPTINYVDTAGTVSERRVKRLMMEIADLREQLKSTGQPSSFPVDLCLAHLQTVVKLSNL